MRRDFMTRGHRNIGARRPAPGVGVTTDSFGTSGCLRRSASLRLTSRATEGGMAELMADRHDAPGCVTDARQTARH